MTSETKPLLIVTLLLQSACSSGSGRTLDPSGPDAAPEDAIDSGVNPDAGSAEDSGPPPPLVWAPCDVQDWPDGYDLPPVDAECTAVEVPLDEEGGPTLALRLARLPSRAFSAPGVLFVIEGGPGGSSVFTSGLIAWALPDLQRRFDVVFVDQRGTGGSGYLGCSRSPRTEVEWNDCAEEHADTGLEHYLTADVVRDLEIVRERLGYEKVSLLATSYGTRIAFEYVRLHPDRIVSAVLDGVAPPAADLFSDTIASVDRGVALLVGDCDADPDCLEVSPNLAQDLESRRQSIADSPRPVVVGGVAMVETEEDFASFLGGLLKQWWWRYRVPAAIHEAVEGDNDAWNGLLSELLQQTVNDGTGSSPLPAAMRLPEPRHLLPVDAFGTPFGSPVVNMAMLCAEALPNSPGLDALEALADEQTWAHAPILEKARSCASWPVDPLDARHRQFVTSDTPTLLVSGAIDLNVDPRWAALALEHLSSATSLVVPYSTHLATYVPCAGQIETDFLAADGDVERVDTSCLDHLRPPRWE